MPFRYNKDPLYRFTARHTDDPSKVDKCLVAVIRRMHLCAKYQRHLTYKAICANNITADAFEKAFNDLKGFIYKKTRLLVDIGRLGEVVSIVVKKEVLQELVSTRTLPATVPGISVTIAMAASSAGELAN